MLSRRSSNSNSNPSHLSTSTTGQLPLKLISGTWKLRLRLTQRSWKLVTCQSWKWSCRLTSTILSYLETRRRTQQWDYFNCINRSQRHCFPCHLNHSPIKSSSRYGSSMRILPHSSRTLKERIWLCMWSDDFWTWMIWKRLRSGLCRVVSKSFSAHPTLHISTCRAVLVTGNF